MVVAAAKAPQRAIVIGLIPLLVLGMRLIRREYDGQAEELAVPDDVVFVGPHREQRVVIPVNGINRAVVQAVNFGRTLSPDLRAVFVTDDRGGEALRRRWVRQFPGVTLVIVESPFRTVIGPVVAYLNVLDQACRRTSRRRSRSSSCPSTWPATGGSGSCTTGRPAA